MHLLVVKGLTLITTLWPLECVSFCLILKTVYKHDNFEFYQNILDQKKTEMQIPTQRYGRRPYGVGLLVAGYDVSS